MSDKMLKIDGQEVSQDEVKKALAALERAKEQRRKAAERAKQNPELKAKADERAKRLRVKNTILCKKAIAAGITVSDREIEEYIATNLGA